MHDYATGKIQAVSIGNVLGPLRTGAIGALAVDLMSRKTASTLTILGSGPQAWSQIWAISSVRDLNKVKVYSPNEQRRTALVQRIRTELEIDAITAENEQAAVQDSDIIVLATNSRQPVINSEWLSPQAHINTLGPKYRGNSEFGTDLIEKCKLAATDSPKQLETYADRLIFSKEQLNEVIGLSSLINKTDLNQLESRRPTIFLSIGLAGTEVFLLQALFNQ
jgi:ornithine cyclodeaminase